MVFTLLVGMFSFPAYAEGNNTTTTISGDGTADKTGTMTITLVIPKKTPAATDLTYTAPSDLTYSGSAKAATVTAKDSVTGMGQITVKYYSDASRTTEATPKNVGTYYVGATVADGDQYAASTAVLYGDGWTFTITASTPSAPAEPTKASATKNSITLNAVSGCEYSKDGATYQDSTEFTGLMPGTEYTFYQRVKATANTNASAASSASFTTEADTYAMTITLVIQEMQASADDVSVAYDGQPHGITVNVTDPASGSTVKYGTAEGTYDLDASPTQTEVGTQTVYYQVTANNYVTKTGSATVTISEASAVAATVTANNRTYDGTEQPLVTVDNTTLVGGSMQYALGTETEATGDFTATIPSKTDAGTYYVWYKVVSDGNHNDYTATAPVTATIAKANASATAPTALNLTYTGQAQALVVAGSTNDGEMQYSLDGVSYSATIPTGTEAKTYSVWYKVVGDSNHNDTAPAKIEVKINPASASPTAPTADTLTYTGEPQALVTGGSVTGGELQYALGEDADTAPALESFTTTVPTGTDAGDYFVWYRIKGDANHNDVAPVCIPVSIAKATIAPTVSITGWTYGEAANAPSVDGNPGSGAVTYEYSDKADGTYTATVPTNAGTWYVRATVAETANYQGATTQPLSFAIAKASITLTAENKSGAYGAEPVKLSYQTSGNVKDDLGVTLSTTATRTSGVGEYPITIGWNGNANYSATLVNGKYTITKAAAAVTAVAAEKTYGEADPTLTYTVTGLVGSDKLTGALSRDKGENAGTYAIRQGTLAASDNYTLTYNGTNLTINKKALTVTAEAKSKTYGEADPELTYTVTGLVGSDKLTGALTRDAGENVGSYAIRQGTLAASANYELNYIEALFTIQAAPEPEPQPEPQPQPQPQPEPQPQPQPQPQPEPQPAVEPSGMLVATMVSEGETSLKLSWAGAEGVGGYDIYFKVCDGKGNYPLIATVEGGDVTSYTVTGLAKNRSYKAYVRAWIMNGGSKRYVLSSSPTVHAYTGNGTKKIANPGSLTLKTPSMTVKLGKTKSIKATVKTVKKGKLANHVAKLRYISSNTSVATVTSKGKVKAVGAGSCKIYVLTTNGIWRTVTVTVDTNPTKVSISKPSKTMKVGATQNLGAKVKLTPAKAITTLSWKSSNPAVATVDSNGVVTAIKKGRTVITVTTANGKKAKVTIKVK